MPQPVHPSENGKNGKNRELANDVPHVRSVKPPFASGHLEQRDKALTVRRVTHVSRVFFHGA
jgi:hypothetical protein